MVGNYRGERIRCQLFIGAVTFRWGVLLMMAEEIGVKVVKPAKIISSIFLNNHWELK